MKKQAMTIAALAAVLGLSVGPAVATVVLSDNFEPGDNPFGGTTPDVTTYTVANTSGQANTVLWQRALQGYGASKNGIVDETENGGANFTDPNGTQAYAFRYTNSGVTTKHSKIGILSANSSWRVTFDVVKDGYNDGLPYTAQLIATPIGAALDDCRTVPTGGLLLKTSSGNATSDGLYENVSFVYSQGDVNDAAYVGYDLVLRFKGATSSANIDNVVIEDLTPPPLPSCTVILLK